MILEITEDESIQLKIEENIYEIRRTADNSILISNLDCIPLSLHVSADVKGVVIGSKEE